jgi:predicted kinase
MIKTSKNLYLLCGIPGSGKSTFVKNDLARTHGKWISRDEVRFSIVNDDEEYFSHEDEVFNTFIIWINEALNNYDDVYVDATHLNERARNKVLKRLNLFDVNIIAVNFNVNVNICLERNSKREGRACVPEKAIRNMYASWHPAKKGELFNYTEIINIE